MKKNIAILLMLVMVLSVAAGCSDKLEGTYKSVAEEDGDFSVTFKDGEMKIDGDGLILEGTYEVKGDKIIMEMEMLGEKTSEELSFKKEGDTIFIDGEEFKKVK